MYIGVSRYIVSCHPKLVFLGIRDKATGFGELEERQSASEVFIYHTTQVTDVCIPARVIYAS